MVYFTQLIYVVTGQEATFEEFESVAIPLIAKYNGELSLRVRPAEEAFISATTETPYEIHFGYFASEADFNAFMRDETRRQFIHLKEKAIRSTVLVTGQRL